MSTVAPLTAKFDPRVFAGALAYYGKPEKYARVFTLGHDGFRPANPAVDSAQSLPVWLQANETARELTLKKPSNAEIVAVRNITLDFEYLPEPGRVHALARAYVARLHELGLVEDGQPVDDSGAGAHVTIPFAHILCADHGGPAVINDAVARVVHDYYEPPFVELATAAGLTGVELEAYDISRVISTPGTWRPGGTKTGEAAYLAAGYLRRYLIPDDGSLPERRESKTVRQFIIDAAAAIQAETDSLLATARHEAAIPSDRPERPGEHFNRTASMQQVAQLLQRYGWTIDHAGRDRTTLTRPDKLRGTSATIRAGTGIPIFYSFSTTCAPFEAKRGYAPFSILTKLEYGDDPAAAASGLAALGYGSAIASPMIVVVDESGDEEETADDEGTTPLATKPMLVDDPVPFIPLKDLKDYIAQEEYGDARLMERIFKDRLVYDHGGAEWHFWTGNAWRRDRTKQVYHLVGGILAAVYLRGVAECKKKITLLESAISGDGDDAAKEASKKELELCQKLVKACVERAQGLRTRKRMNNVLAVAEAFLKLTGNEWDSKATLLAVANGVIDLTTGELQPGQPKDFLRAAAPTTWTGLDTPAPGWDKFLTEMFMGRPDMPSFLQRLCGLGVRGDVPEHRLPILHGARGRNGKDVLLGTLHMVLGSDIASAIEEDALIGRKRTGGANPSVMDLQGKRIVWISETSERARLNAGQVKLITGGGDITARQLYGKNVTFQPSHLIWLITNFLPQGSHDDDALWDRLICIECKERFVDEPDKANEHEHERDPFLKEKLRAEASGILAWLVRGHLAWQDYGLLPPEEVKLSTKEYKESQDTLSAFLVDACELEEGATVRAMQLYEAYVEWVGKRLAVSNKAFGEYMKKRFTSDRGSKGIVYFGIKLVAVPSKMQFGDDPP